MSEHDLTPLDAELASLLNAERAPEMLPQEVRARLWSRVQGSLDMPPDGGGGASQESGAAPASAAPASLPKVAASAAVGAKSVWLAGAFVLGATVGVGTYATVQTPPEPQIREVVRDVVREVRVEVPVPMPVELMAREQAPASNAVNDADAHRATKRSEPATPAVAVAAEVPTPTVPGSAIDNGAERTMIMHAQTALARGRAQEAVNVLREHTAQYASGAFAEEREALLVQALASSGHQSEARVRAQDFLRRYPRSIFREAVETAVQP